MQNNNASIVRLLDRADAITRLADGWAVFVNGVMLSKFPKCRCDLAVLARKEVQEMLPDARVEIRAL